MLVKEVNRGAAVAWSPLASHPNLIAAGTLAGTMNVDFDPTVGSLSTSERFYKLNWKNLLPNHYKHGLIVGGFGTGTVNLWNPTPLIEKHSSYDGLDPLVASVAVHSGPVTALDFNPLQPTLLASGGPKGELYIFNLADPKNPTVHQPGTSTQGSISDPITSVAFHPKHKHILAASSNRTTVIWDLREKRPAFSFSDPNRNFHCKSICWHPDQPMQIATASDDDEMPFVHIWDLHMTIAPSQQLKSHKNGIMSLSWCQADRSLLVSTGKDNRTLCWDVSTSSLVSEVGSSGGWNLDCQWSPKLPTMLSVCSLEGKLRIYSMQDFENQATQQSMEIANQKMHSKNQSGRPMSEDDLFNTKGNSNHLLNHHHNQDHNFNHFNHLSLSGIVHASRQLENGAKIPTRPPVWLRRPSGVSFGFGGKIITFGSNNRNINIGILETEKGLAERAVALQSALNSGNLREFCTSKIEQLTSRSSYDSGHRYTSPTSFDIETWGFLSSLLQSKPRQEILQFLNHDPESMSSQINEYLRTLPTPPGMLVSSHDGDDTGGGSSAANLVKHSTDAFDTLESSMESPSEPANSNVKLQEDVDFFGDDDGEGNDGFGKFEVPQSAIQAAKQAELNMIKSSSDNPEQKRQSSLTQESLNNASLWPKAPVDLNNTSSEYERVLTNAMLIGDFEAAVDCCVRLGKMTDALIMASCGGMELYNKTQNIYFRQNKDKSYVCLMNSIANKDLNGLIAKIDLNCWKEALAILCTYSKTEEFESKCAMLGERLASSQMTREATLCFICAGNADRVTSIWLQQASTGVAAQIQNGHTESSGSADQRQQSNLQELMEKIVIFSAAIKLDPSKIPDVVLDQYSRYAQLLANQGNFDIALCYLSKVYSAISNSSSHAATSTSILLDRVYNAVPPHIAQQSFPGHPPTLYKRQSAYHHISNNTPTSASKGSTKKNIPVPTTNLNFAGQQIISAGNPSSFGNNAQGNKSIPAPIHPVGYPKGPTYTAQTSATSAGSPAVHQDPRMVGSRSHVQQNISANQFVPVTPGQAGMQFKPVSPVSTFQPLPPVAHSMPPAPTSTGITHYAPPHAAGPVSTSKQIGHHGPVASFTPIAPPPLHTGANSTGSNAFVPDSTAVESSKPSSVVKAPRPKVSAPASFVRSSPASTTSYASTVATTMSTSTAGGATTPLSGSNDNVLTSSTGPTSEPPKKKKPKSKPLASTAATTAKPVPVASGSISVQPVGFNATPASGVVYSAPPPNTGIQQMSGAVYGANNQMSDNMAARMLPPPKTHTSRVQAPKIAVAAPSATVSAGIVPPHSHHHSAGQHFPQAPSTWDPQAPLPPHLTGGASNYAAGPYVPPTPPSFHSYQPPAPMSTYHPPPLPAAPTTAFIPPPAASGFGGSPSTFNSFQPMPIPSPMTAAPTATMPPPPPKPGKAKRDMPAAATTNTPTPVYVTGPQAEAAAAPKSHEITQEELGLMNTLVAMLDKIQGTADPAHADLVDRFADLSQKITSGSIPPVTIEALTQFADLMNSSEYKEAQTKHGELTAAHFQQIGSKAMLGLKRMLILASKYKL